MPVAWLFGVTAAADPDGCTVELVVPPTARDGDGALPTGALAVLADHALGRRLSEVLEPDERMVTSHMHLEIVRPPQPGVDRYVGEAQEVHRVPGSGFSRGSIRDANGALVALISARFALIPAGDMQGGAVLDQRAASIDPSEATPPTQPWSGVPVHQLLGTRMRRESEGQVEVDFLAAPELANERSGLHGGVGALMGERAAALALQGRAAFRPVELRIVFLRPVPAVGQRVRADAEIIFLGRTTATTSARLYRADGKVAVQVDAVHAVPPANR